LLDTPVDLPTSEPDTPQYEWTVAGGDLPAFSLTLKSVKYIGCFYAAGKNVSGATRTVYIRMTKNGSSVSTANSSVGDATFYTRSCFFYDIAVSDVLGIKLWANDTGVNRDYQARQVHPSRIFLLPEAELMKPLDFTTVVVHPTLVLGNPGGSKTNFLVYFPNVSLQTGVDASSKVEELRQHSTYGIYRLGYGDATTSNSSNTGISATQRPRYYQNRIPTQIVFRSYGELT